MKTIEKDWTTKHGHRAVVLLLEHANNIAWRTGYVAVRSTHPLFRVEYSEQAPVITQEMVDGCSIGQKSPILALTCGVRSDGEDKVRRSPDLLIDCHGGLTYSGADSKYPAKSDPLDEWWFGFDCNHCDDDISKCTLNFCVQQCESISEQLAKLK